MPLYDHNSIPAATKEPTGFETRTTSTLSFDSNPVSPTFLQFTIAPTGTTFNIWSQGLLYQKITSTVSITNTVGMWYIYFDTDGTLKASQTEWVFVDGKIPVATVYWNGTVAMVGDERHGIVMDGMTHAYLHYAIGARYGEGLTLTINDTTFSMDSGIIFDEDIRVVVNAVTQARVLYRNSTTWEFTAQQAKWYIESADVLQYDNDGALAAVTNNYYMAMWFFATNNTENQIWILTGQRQDLKLVDARNNNTYESLNLSTLPSAEMKLLYRVIVQRNGTSEVWIETADMRSVANLPGGTYNATNHGSLAGRDLPGQHPATALTVDTTNFAGRLYSIDDTVQKALDRLDDSGNTWFTTQTDGTGDGYFRIASMPVTGEKSTVVFYVRAATPSGTVSEATIIVNLAARLDNYASQYSSVLCMTSHSYNTESNVENGWVLRYCRLSFDATTAYLDMYVYKNTTVVTMKVMPLTVSDWTWATGTLTRNPTVGSYRNTQATMSYGARGNYITANTADSATYSTYGSYGGGTLANTADKTDKWEYFGYVTLTYNSAYLSGHSIHHKVILKEMTHDAAVAPADFENIILDIKTTLAAHADANEFNTAVPAIAIEVDGKMNIDPTIDIAALVFSTSTTSKIIRFYIKLKTATKHYIAVHEGSRLGFAYNATKGKSTAYTTYTNATNQTPITSLPTPGQGSIIYGTLVGSGLSQLSHRALDQLVHEVAEDSYEEITRDINGRVSGIIYWTDSGKTLKIREYALTRNVDAKVEIVTTYQYNGSGTVAETYVETLSRTSGQVTSITGALS